MNMVNIVNIMLCQCVLSSSKAASSQPICFFSIILFYAERCYPCLTVAHVQAFIFEDQLAHHLLLAEKTFVFLKEAIAKRIFFLGGGYEVEAIKPKAKMDPTYKPHILNI